MTMTFLDCWIKAASALFPQALTGEPGFSEAPAGAVQTGSWCVSAAVGGEIEGRFLVLLDPELMAAPLLGEGADPRAAWIELLREVAEAAAADLLARTGRKCWIQSVGEEKTLPDSASHAFELRSGDRVWILQACDQVLVAASAARPLFDGEGAVGGAAREAEREQPSIGLLQDVELETTLRFGCRELQLGEVLSLGPGDVVQLDRHISDPVDLIVGDKIVARGEVVLVNGNFGLRVTEVAAPRERLESIRCLF